MVFRGEKHELYTIGELFKDFKEGSDRIKLVVKEGTLEKSVKNS